MRRGPRTTRGEAVLHIFYLNHRPNQRTPGMSDWTLIETNDHGPASRPIGYAVKDALGVRLGYVSGLLADPGGEVRMIKVSVSEWEGSTDYLIPVGGVTLISDTKGLVQLRDLTKHSIGRRCYHFRGELPEARLLTSLQRHFPPVRPSVAERLALVGSGDSEPRLSWQKLSELTRARRLRS